MHSPTKKTIYDLFGYFPSMVIPSILGVIGVAVYTRFLVPEEYGLFTLIFTTALIIECFLYNWLFQSIIRYYERYKSTDADRFYSTSFYGTVFVSLLFVIVFLVLIYPLDHFLSPRARQIVLYLPLMVICQAGFKFTLTFFRAMRKGVHYSLSLSLESLFKLTGSLVMIYFFCQTADAIVVGICISAAILFAYNSFAFSRRFTLRLAHIRRQLLRQFARFGFPLVSLLVINLVISASDRYLLAILMDSSTVGIYSAGYRIAQVVIWSIVYYLSLPFYPAIVESFEKDGQTQTVGLVRNLLSVYLVILVPAVAGISLLSDGIISMLLGVDYQPSYIVLPWIAAGVFFNGLAGFYVKSFELLEKTSWLPLIYLGPALVNVALNLWMIPEMGMRGAAVATFSAYFCLFLILKITSARYIAWSFPLKTLLRVIGATAVMCAVIVHLPEVTPMWANLFLQVAVGFCVYAAIIAVLEKRILQYSFELMKKKA